MKKKSAGEWLHGNLMWIALIPVVITMVLIFSFSSQTAKTSIEISNRFTDAVIKLFVRNYDDLPQARQRKIRIKTSYIVRKTAHVIEYTVLGFFSMLYVETINLKMRIRPGILKYLLTLIFTLAYAVSDEFHQKFVSGRGGMTTDVFIDGIGVIIGMVLLEILIFTLIKRKLKQKNAESRE